ncbi:FAD/NAD(P)-binding protein [Nostoc flagelliforme]|uniref:FAD/NAD(P)-binding protein n=1 Tax=Nostoc flagelliforme TaxID=1306274 RepID=UPI0030D9828B
MVGAGIAGITPARLLKRAGKTVAVIESQQISTGLAVILQPKLPCFTNRLGTFNRIRVS